MVFRSLLRFSWLRDTALVGVMGGSGVVARAVGLTVVLVRVS